MSGDRSVYAPENGRACFEAVTCREAAAVLKLLADNATPGVWGVGNGDTLATDVTQTGQGSFSCAFTVATMTDEDDRWRDGHGTEPEYVDNPAAPVDDAAYIALMQPSVGRALADLLEHTGVEVLRTAELPPPEIMAVATAIVAIKYPLAEQVRYDLPKLEES